MVIIRQFFNKFAVKFWKQAQYSPGFQICFEMSKVIIFKRSIGLQTNEWQFSLTGFYDEAC